MGRNPVFVLGDGDFVGNNGDLRYSDLARLTLIGSDGNDVLWGGNSNDSSNAGRGDDTAYGLGGGDRDRCKAEVKYSCER